MQVMCTYADSGPSPLIHSYGGLGSSDDRHTQMVCAEYTLSGDQAKESERMVGRGEERHSCGDT